MADWSDDDWSDGEQDMEHVQHIIDMMPTDEETLKKESGVRGTVPASDVIVLSRGMVLDPGPMIGSLFRVVPAHKYDKLRHYLRFLTLNLYGLRNVRKVPVPVSQLGVGEQAVYKSIKKKLRANPKLVAKIDAFRSVPGRSARLINFFVVTFSARVPVEYWQDRRKWPYKIISRVRDDAKVLALKEQGANVVWVNLFQEYKNGKLYDGRRNCSAPFRRNKLVQDGPGPEDVLSLCELNFFLWFEDISGMEIFEIYEKKIKAKKAEADHRRATVPAIKDGTPARRRLHSEPPSRDNFPIVALKYKKRPPPVPVVGQPWTPALAATMGPDHGQEAGDEPED